MAKKYKTQWQTESNQYRKEHVAFRYGSRVNVFDDLCLKIKVGSFTAIVGESGSGKSTLMSLLQNIYPIQSGNIFIGNHALKYLNSNYLRNLPSVVPQKIDLFAGNVIENIAIGDYEPNMQQIISICTQLGIIDFIEALPEGFQTYLGENGASLSGGQKQRIAIARALYRNPEILILDGSHFLFRFSLGAVCAAYNRYVEDAKENNHHHCASVTYD